MRRACFLYLALGLLTSAAGALAQNVEFQILPAPGTTVNPGNNPAVVVQPGTVLSYEVVVAAQSDPVFPNRAGIAAFNFDVLTNFGLGQTTPFTFSDNVGGLFTFEPAIGTFTGDDVLGIGASQGLGTTSSVLTNFGLNTQQVIGTGQLVTPGVEGDFTVDLVGTADLFDMGTNPLTTVPGVVGTTRGFTVSTRFEGSETPTDPGDGTDDPGNGDGTGSEDPPEVVEVPGGTSGPTGPGGSGGDGEQVAGEFPESPTTINSLGSGFCGLGAASSLSLTLLGLGLMRRQTH